MLEIINFLQINRISQLPQDAEEAELDKLLGIAVDVENLFMCANKEEDSDTKQVLKSYSNFSVLVY